MHICKRGHMSSHPFAERYNKKCKNLTSNKHRPFQSLANSLVRDAVARYHRWRRGVESAPKTGRNAAVTGRAVQYEMSPDVRRQIMLPCGCRTENSVVYRHKMAVICGKEFTAGERLISGKRCGSIVCAVFRGKSVYGRVVNFVRVMCDCVKVFDFALVTWFPPPRYPDGDPLTVRIDLDGIDVNNIPRVRVVSLNDIQPSRIMVEIEKDCMYMMRKDGVDTVVET